MLPPLAFILFGRNHLLSLAAIAAFFLGTCLLLRNGNARTQKITIGVLVSMCFLSWPLGWASYLATDAVIRLDNIIPLHLCSITAVLAGFALMTRSPLLCELTFYWGLAGTLQALITPAVERDFPHPIAFQFFYSHGLVVSIALLLPLGLKWRPRRPLHRTIHRSFFWINIYTVIAFSLNFILPTNYGYFREKPESASLLDHFGPWPYYILVMEILAYGLFWLFSLPFIFSEKEAEH